MRRLMADGRGWRRTPRAVRRVSGEHRGETGIVLHRSGIGRSFRSPAVGARPSVTVTAARPGPSRTAALEAWLDDARVGREGPEPVEPEVRRADLPSGPPAWVGVAPGRHTIDFHGFGVPLRAQTVRLGPGDHFLVAYRAPVRLPFRRSLPARWRLEALPAETRSTSRRLPLPPRRRR